ncbi:MAG: AlpA family transcriptional regulator [bacterium]|nr:AlpA family transcriptional regulator [bacterium]
MTTGPPGTYDRLLTRRQIEERCGLSTSSIYRLMDKGLFPRPLRIGSRAVRWPESEIEAWLSTRPRSYGDRPHP